MSNIQAETIAEQKQWGKNNDLNLGLKAQMSAVQVSPHKKCTSCSGLSTTSIIKLDVCVCMHGYKCESVQKYVRTLLGVWEWSCTVWIYVCGLWMCACTWLLM